MNRKHNTYKGVYQRCQPDCPADRCRNHRWAWTFETAAGPDGRRRRLGKGGYSTAKDARDDREETVQAVRKGQAPVNDRKRTFASWSLEWVAAKRERGDLRHSTATSYELALKNHLLPRIGRLKLVELTGYHLTLAYAEINKVTSPASVARIHAMVHGCLDSAVKAGLVVENVAPRAERPKRTKVRITPWTPEQLATFLDYLDGHDLRMSVLVDVAAHSGLRRGELLGLQWADVDLGEGEVQVRRQRTTVAGQVQLLDQTKTDAGIRSVSLGRGICAVLRSWKATQAKQRLAWGPAYRDEGWVFTWEDGRPLHPDEVTKRFQRLLRRSGLPPTRFHDLRHLRAAALISSGAGVEQVSKMLGHASVEVTSSIYSHLYKQARRDLAEAADQQTPRRRAV